jgi:hypothetical protein
LIPLPPSAANTFPICATQINEVDTPGQLLGDTCGNNPNFKCVGGGWTMLAPNTCLGITACTYQLNGLTYTTPNYFVLSVSASNSSTLQAQIVNCPNTDPFNPSACDLSDHNPTVPLSHSAQWNVTSGGSVQNTGPEAVLIVKQISTSNANDFPTFEYPGQFVLITDQYGNADLVFFSTTFMACTGTCPQ